MDATWRSLKKVCLTCEKPVHPSKHQVEIRADGKIRLTTECVDCGTKEMETTFKAMTEFCAKMDADEGLSPEAVECIKNGEPVLPLALGIH